MVATLMTPASQDYHFSFSLIVLGDQRVVVAINASTGACTAEIPQAEIAGWTWRTAFGDGADFTAIPPLSGRVLVGTR